MARRSNEDIVLFHEYDIDLPSRTIYLGHPHYGSEEDEVDNVMSGRFIKNLKVLERTATKERSQITVILNTRGGDVTQGMAIYDAIKEFPYHVTIKVSGHAESMGAIILQAADERVMSKNAVFMMHDGEEMYPSSHKTKIRNQYEFARKVDKRCNDILYERIIEKNPDFKYKKLEELLIFDKNMFADEAIAMGLIDKIAEDGASDA